ncbi:hypothetical protein FACS1894219_12410 [Clostridia bacterium]|nr:hypothetical protein FACS1894219_12410 [Clostridia bacterium]
MKTLIGIALVIILAVAIIVPVTRSNTAAKLEAQRVQIELEAAQSEIEALKAAEKTENSAETAETETPQETSQTEPLTAVKAEEVKAAEPEAVEVKAEPKPTPKPEVKQTPPPQVKTDTYPKEFYIDGQKYAYLTAYAEEADIKTFIADEDESASTQESYYDPSQDPLSKVKGPFQ